MAASSWGEDGGIEPVYLLKGEKGTMQKSWEVGAENNCNLLFLSS
jgi:hypothetical protein